MSLLINPINIDDIKSDEYLLVGLHSFSHSINHILTIDELLVLIKTNNKVFLLINHLIDNEKLESLNHILNTLSQTNLYGLLFEDYAVLNLVKKYNYQINLYLASKNSITSSSLINQSDSLVLGALVSNDLSLEELILLLNNTHKKTLIHAYGYQLIYYSKRPVISNYQKTFHLSQLKNYQVKRKDNCYSLIEEKGYSYLYSDKIFNSINYLNELPADFYLINSYLVDEDIFNRDLEAFRHQLTYELDDRYSLYQLVNPNYYKVKHHE